MIFAKKPQNVEYDYVPFKGGWDLISPTLATAPGVLRDCQNFEVAPVLTGGYSRIAGYERYDGRPSPTNAVFTLIQVTSFTNLPTIGATVTGQTSAATGVVIAVSGSYFAVTKVVGAFVNSEQIKQGATVIGTTAPLTTVLSPLLTAQYTQAAADIYRADIGQVPGSGPVRGVVQATVSGVDHVYAFRDNVGATATLLYVASSTGWTLVPFYNEVSFTVGGAVQPADGTTLTQGAVTATIKRVMTQSGSWTGNTAAGRLIITNPTGGNFAAGAATIGGVNVTLSGVQSTITLSPGGKFQFVIGNFFGQATSIRVYGCDGVNRAFEFDGDALCPISTGTSPDSPKHIAINQKQLFLAFLSSAIHSAPGLPYNWTAIAGASELPCGDVVTNFQTQPGSSNSGAFLITTVSNTYLLYGTGVSNWNLVPFNTGIGGQHYTVAQLNQTYWLDDPGVMNLQTTLYYGNFIQSTITTNIQPFILARNTTPVVAVQSHAKSQYRLYYQDGSALYITIVNGKIFGMAKVLFADSLHCVWNSMTSSFTESIFAGGETSGYVYQLDRGSSFDGQPISAWLTFNWNAQRSPRVIKRYRHASLEMTGSFYANVSFGYALGYNDPNLIQEPTVAYNSAVTGTPLWDSMTWDAFNWDGVTVSPTEVQMYGSGVNVQVTLSCGTNYIQPFTINSMTIHYTPRRGVRS